MEEGTRRADLVAVDEPGRKFKVHARLLDQLHPVGELNQHPRNYNNGDVDFIRESLDEHAQYTPIVVNEGGYSERYGENVIAKGNHTYLAALEDGWTHIAVSWINVDDDALDRILVVDNYSARRARIDEGIVLDIVEERGTHGTGLTDDDVLEMRERNDRPLAFVEDEEEEAEDPADEAPSPPEDPKTKLGEVWIMEDQRLMIGDATKVAHVQRLLGAEKSVDVLITSPPYGVGKVYEGQDETTRSNEWRLLMDAWVAVWKKVAPVGMVNIADRKVGADHREEHTYGEFVELCKAAGWPLIGTRIWGKVLPVWFAGMYYTSSYRAVDEWEYLGLFGKAKFVKRLGEEDDWRFRGIWRIPSVNKNDDHPAKFPVELPRRYVKMLTDEGGSVVDPFVGSGTTLLACHELGRRGFGMDLDPGYADVTLQRFLDFTGIMPYREEDGASWEEVRDEVRE